MNERWMRDAGKNVAKNEKENDMEEEIVLSWKDFYPPEDGRVYESNVESVAGCGYFEYAECFWELYEDELFDCNN